MDSKAKTTPLEIEPVTEVGSTSHGDVFVHDMKQGELDKFGTTKRGLKSRHVQLMAIAGSIGTALVS